MKADNPDPCDAGAPIHDQLIVEPDEDRWRAYCPALETQGASTWGHTREEAERRLREVLEMIATEEGGT